MKPPQDPYRQILDGITDGVYFTDADRRITYWSRGAERITGYAAEQVVGKSCAEGILVHTDEEGRLLCGRARCPALSAMETGRCAEKRIFLKHRHGYRVPVITRVTPIRDDTGSIVGAAEVFSRESETHAVEAHIEELKKTALLDPLTQVGNRRLGEKELGDRIDEFERYGWDFGVLFVDLDRFKQVNDIQGHEVGDRLLRMAARTLSYSVRSSDTVIRWGGDEFLVMLKNITRQDLVATSRKLLGLVRSCRLDTGTFQLSVTVSIGATLAQFDDTIETVLQRADAAMYASKKRGGDRVSVAEGGSHVLTTAMPGAPLAG